MRKTIREWLQTNQPDSAARISGWVRTRRDNKAFSFLELNDGSCLQNLQVIIDAGTPGSEHLPQMTTGSAVTVNGEWLASQGSAQAWELHAREISLLGTAPADYPLQKKGHSPEFLRSIAHLRPRTNLYGAMFRLRSAMSHAVHDFFRERNFHYIHTPIITASDCEGAGEMFRVTTLDPTQAKPAKWDDDFFGKATHLTVSGQLEGETFACALGQIYTFGPTFRAENSNTSRHAAEFWMIEPEMAFCDLNDDMDLAESMVQFLVQRALDHPDLEIFEKFVDRELRSRLQAVASTPFERISYTDAIDILLQSKQSFEYPVAYGQNLQSEHERWLTEHYAKKPVTLFNYPKEIKPFYMRANDDGKTVAAMDLLVPGIGELVGGSQREERLDVLLANMAQHGLSTDDYGWYADLRKYGTVPHAGFGMGFERLLMFVSGMSNIRDVIPFVRTPRHCEF